MDLVSVGSATAAAAAASLQTSMTSSSWRLRSPKRKGKKKTKNYIFESLVDIGVASLDMSNQLHDSEGGPLFKIKHCNLIMCGLIKGPCVHPQPCTTSSTWLKSPREEDGGGRRRRRS